MKKNVIGLTFVLLSLFIFGCKVDVNNSDTDPVKTEKLISRPSGFDIFTISLVCDTQKAPPYTSENLILRVPLVSTLPSLLSQTSE